MIYRFTRFTAKSTLPTLVDIGKVLPISFRATPKNNKALYHVFQFKALIVLLLCYAIL